MSTVLTPGADVTAKPAAPVVISSPGVGCGPGCATPAAGCGCDPCAAGGKAGLLTRLKARFGASSDCGCAPAPAPAPTCNTCNKCDPCPPVPPNLLDTIRAKMAAKKAKSSCGCDPCATATPGCASPLPPGATPVPATPPAKTPDVMPKVTPKGGNIP